MFPFVVYSFVSLFRLLRWYIVRKTCSSPLVFFYMTAGSDVSFVQGLTRGFGMFYVRYSLGHACYLKFDGLLPTLCILSPHLQSNE